MPNAVIYHNPRCSNSRGALALLQAHGCTLRIVDYLKSPPARREIAELLERYDGSPADFVRFKEAAAVEHGLGPESEVPAIIAAIVASPVLLQRPIVVFGRQVIIARPPEVLLPLLAPKPGAR